MFYTSRSTTVVMPRATPLCAHEERHRGDGSTGCGGARTMCQANTCQATCQANTCQAMCQAKALSAHSASDTVIAKKTTHRPYATTGTWLPSTPRQSPSEHGSCCKSAEPRRGLSAPGRTTGLLPGGSTRRKRNAADEELHCGNCEMRAHGNIGVGNA